MQIVAKLQPKTKRLRAEWRLVQARAHVVGYPLDPESSTLYLHPGGRSIGFRADQQPAALRHRIRGIHDQVEQRRAHPPAVDAGLQPFVAAAGSVDAPVCKRRSQSTQDLLDQRFDAGRRRVS